MKSFDIPTFYRSSFIGDLKNSRKNTDPRKKDFSPTILNFGPVKIVLARHFGFCFGVENAIERAYKALEENPGKRIFLISHMIHNPAVNQDLEENGIRFILDTEGNQLIEWDEINADDVVLIPAFGTTLEIEALLKSKNVNLETYNTTCPFVERVWKKSNKLGEGKYTVIIHGKPKHEETRATFSHSAKSAHSIVIKDMKEAELLASFIQTDKTQEEFEITFADRFSEGFDVKEHLQRVGVVNQTTMLASETQAIADFFSAKMNTFFGIENSKEHFADTRDTLCYATNDNQTSTFELLKEPADLALVIGGYNSSNTSHIAELCEKKFPTYFIKGEEEIIDSKVIKHWDYENTKYLQTENWLPNKKSGTIVITSGASCPDKILESVLDKVLSFFPNLKSKEEVLEEWKI